ncbi:MAG: thiamine-binding protein [Acidimicrobiales bacterium]
MALELEFTVEPFDAGRPGPHVKAAEDAARATGAELRIGPFGTVVTGEAEQVMSAVSDVVRAATAAGATRVTLQVSTKDPDGELGA